MIAIFAVASQVALALFSLAVGIRLLALARHTRQLPEFLLGLVGIAGFVCHSQQLTLVLTDLSEHYPLLMGYVLRISMLVIHGFMVLVAWRVFRPESPGAGFAAGAICIALFTTVMFDQAKLLGSVTGADRFFHPIYLGYYLSLIASLLWPGIEALLYFSTARKRLRLGIERNPVAVNRAFLLGLGFSVLSLFWIASFVQAISLTFWGVEAVNTYVVLIATSSTWCLSVWLAFFPPRLYKSWLARTSPVPMTS